MRVRAEDRRQAIINVAIEVFLDVGFERASMAMISRRLGGSKGTLYGYFQSKDELFETAMKAASERSGDEVMKLLDEKSRDLRGVLIRFAKAYLAFICGETVLKITRTAIAEGHASSLGPHLFEQGPGRALAKMESYFGKQIDAGRLRPSSSVTASLQFKGLIEAGFLEEALYGAPTRDETVIGEAIDTFLSVYGPVRSDGRNPRELRHPDPD